VLKKAGITVAVATAGMLVLSPFAFAADEDDTIGQGNNSPGTGNTTEFCTESINSNGFIFGDSEDDSEGDSEGEDCEVDAEAINQERKQFDRNED